MHLGAGAVGDVYRGREPLERHRAPQEFSGIRGYRRRDFRGDYKLAAAQPCLQLASCTTFANHGSAMLAPASIRLVLQVLPAHYDLHSVALLVRQAREVHIE